MSLLDDIKDFPASRWGRHLAPHHAKRLQTLAPRMRQFIFDEEASRKLGHFIRECPDIIVDQLEFARLPYDPCYIEIDLIAAHEALGHPTTAMFNPSDPDWRLGFACDGFTVKTLVNIKADPEAKVAIHGIFDLESGGKSVLTPNMGSQEIMLGTSFDYLTPARRETFCKRFGLGYFGPDGREAEYGKFYKMAVGEGRTFAAALLMLYQQRGVTIGDRPFERRVTRGKLRTFMAHHTVTIHLEAPEMRKAWAGGHHASPRRHEVRTHYAHRHGTRQCVHEWVKIEDAKNEQWRCQRCDRLRWLKRSHLRGDAGKGFVTKSYSVQV